MPGSPAENADETFDLILLGISHEKIQKESQAQRTKWLKIQQGFYQMLKTTKQDNIACVDSKETGTQQAVIQWLGELRYIPHLSCNQVLQKWSAVTTEITECQQMTNIGRSPTIVVDRFNGIPLTVKITCEQLSSIKLIFMSTPGYASDPKTVYVPAEIEPTINQQAPKSTFDKGGTELTYFLPSLTSTFLSSAIYSAGLTALNKTSAWTLQKCGMNVRDAHDVADSLQKTVSWGLLGWQSPWRTVALAGSISFINYLPFRDTEKAWISTLAPQVLYLAIDAFSEAPVNYPAKIMDKVIYTGTIIAGNVVGEVLVKKAPSIWQACCNWWNQAPAPEVNDNPLPQAQNIPQL
jgi:hypothetical protein